jgi:hypothetical protein
MIDVYKNDNIALSTMLKKIEGDHIILKVISYSRLKAKYRECEIDHTKLTNRKLLLEKMINERDLELSRIKTENS